MIEEQDNGLYGYTVNEYSSKVINWFLTYFQLDLLTQKDIFLQIVHMSKIITILYHGDLG